MCNSCSLDKIIEKEGNVLEVFLDGKLETIDVKGLLLETCFMSVYDVQLLMKHADWHLEISCHEIVGAYKAGLKFKEKSVKKFKLGDKVKVTRDLLDLSIEEGTTGVVVQIEEDSLVTEYTVSFEGTNICTCSTDWLELVEEADKPSGKIKPKPKILVLGLAKHGKDTFSEVLRDNYGYAFEPSSKRIIEEFFPLIQEVYEWESVEDAYEFRDEMRPFLHQLIKGCNGRDKTRMAKIILQDNDVYSGMRDVEVVQACMEQGLFDLIVWVDAKERLGVTEDESSCNVDKSYADIIIENNEDEYEFRQKVKALVEVIGK